MRSFEKETSVSGVMMSLLSFSMICVASLPGSAQTNAAFGNALSSPTYVNLYWDATWDTDNASTVGMTKAALDAFTAAMLNSSYFGGLAEYGVGMPTFGGGFLPSPLCPPKPPPRVLFYNPAYASIIGFLNCELANGGVPLGSQVIYNIILPFGTLEADLPSPATAFHFHQTPYSFAAVLALGAALLAIDTGAGAATFTAFLAGLGALQGGPIYTIETVDPRRGNIFTESLLHEMVEAASDPFPTVDTIFIFENEVADVAKAKKCPDTHPFVPPASLPAFSGMFTTAGTISVPQYWSNAGQACVTGFASVTPTPVTLTVDSKSFAVTITGMGFGTLPAAFVPIIPGTPPTIAPLMPYIAAQDDTIGVQSGSLNSVTPGSLGTQLTVTLWTERSITIAPSPPIHLWTRPQHLVLGL